MDARMQFSMELERAMKHMREQGAWREGLVVLARRLQGELSSDVNSRRHPNSQSLELVMRSVIAVLEDHPKEWDVRSYIVDNLRSGLSGLFHELHIKPEDLHQ